MIRVLLLILLLATNVWAAPAITSVTGTVSDGKSITISGSWFGATGPNIELFDSFTGTAGQNISLTGAEIGEWSRYQESETTPVYSSTAASGNTSAWIIKEDSDSQLIISPFANGQCTEFFLSYYVRVPEGSYFPGTSTTESFDTGASAFKFTWIMDADENISGEDVCIPSMIGQQSRHHLTGNGVTFSTSIYYLTSSWTWTGWNKIGAWIKEGNQWLQLVGSSQSTDTDTQAVFEAGESWGSFKVQGWHKNNATYASYYNVLYDDMYLAVGPNAAARIELGNNATYTSCTKLAICTPTSWADGSITATVREGVFDAGDTVYLFVIDADNTPSTGSGPYTFGATLGSLATTSAGAVMSGAVQ